MTIKTAKGILKIIFLIGGLLIMINNKVISQNETNNSTINNKVADIAKVPFVPIMWVSKETSIERKQQFAKPGLLSASKYKRLSEIIDIPESKSIFYSIESFKCLLTTMETQNKGYPNLRIHFASYDNKHTEAIDGTPIAGLPDQTLTIIFSPANKTKNDIGNFYFIRPVDGKVYQIKGDTKKYWIASYEHNKLPLLGKTIKQFKNAEENHCEENIKYNFSDTKSILYVKDAIEETFITEIDYQYNTCKITVSGIQIDFCAYTRKGQLSTEYYPGKYKKRLAIQFEYTKKNSSSGKDEVFYIDDHCNFNDRLEYTKRMIEETKALNNNDIRIRGFNHGDLCPPKICN